MTQRLIDRRIRLLLVVIIVVFGGAFGRAVWLQAVRAQPLGELAATQQRQTVEVPARRGTIFDRNGAPLALGEQATTVYADPTQVLDARAVATAAERTLGVDAEELYPKLLDRRKGFVYVARQADADDAARLAARKLPGLGFYPEERRRYPLGPLGAQVLGFAGADNVGLAGVELSLDHVLRGRPGKEVVVRDPFGRIVDVLSATDERPGRDVFLTLDRRIQAEVEEVLDRTVQRWSARSATAIVLDPRTGEVLAMANAPTFDTNRFAEVPPAMQRNRAVSDAYEPGSTFKLIPVAGALSEGLVLPTTTFTLAPTIRVADRVIGEHDARPTETMSVSRILSESSNVGTVTLAQQLGETRLARWIDRFGFGRPTGIDFPGETRGIVLPAERWSGSTIGNVPIGQGIAVTPLQMAAAYAAVANGGVWVEPHLLDHVAGGRRARPVRRRVVTRGVATQLATMLRGVVDDGTGRLAAISGYRVAGKTGTAAKPAPRGGYSTSNYVASFVGFVPATRPRLVISVAVDEPRGAIWGGVVAAPAFNEIARYCLPYLEVPPDAPDTP
ncbi:MAG TPA: penicillin-binding protein 2 [Actinomycetota bacterium]|nr:penicillin-binding protein 2 [Actinomycetota bacterium]